MKDWICDGLVRLIRWLSYRQALTQYKIDCAKGKVIYHQDRWGTTPPKPKR